MKSKFHLHHYLNLAIHCSLLNVLEFIPFICSHLQSFVPECQDPVSGCYCPEGAVELCREGCSTRSSSSYSQSLTRQKVEVLYARLDSREKLHNGAERGKVCSTLLCLKLLRKLFWWCFSFFFFIDLNSCIWGPTVFGTCKEGKCL